MYQLISYIGINICIYYYFFLFKMYLKLFMFIRFPPPPSYPKFGDFPMWRGATLNFKGLQFPGPTDSEKHSTKRDHRPTGEMIWANVCSKLFPFLTRKLSRLNGSQSPCFHGTVAPPSLHAMPRHIGESPNRVVRGNFAIHTKIQLESEVCRTPCAEDFLP